MRTSTCDLLKESLGFDHRVALFCNVLPKERPTLCTAPSRRAMLMDGEESGEEEAELVLEAEEVEEVEEPKEVEEAPADSNAPANCIQRIVPAREAEPLDAHRRTNSIQRFYRGYRSRRYAHDFYARKAYIAAAVERGDAVRRRLADAHATQTHSKQIESERAKATKTHIPHM